MDGARQRSSAHFHPQRSGEFSSGYSLGGLKQGVQVAAGKAADVVDARERWGKRGVAGYTCCGIGAGEVGYGAVLYGAVLCELVVIDASR